MKVLLALFGVSSIVMAYRFVAGIGAVSNMTDGFTWGIWEPVNVVVFTGIGAGAYGVGLLCYLLNKGEYHGLVRPAVLRRRHRLHAGRQLDRHRPRALLERGRSCPSSRGGTSSSALLEVAVCVMAYVCVLWVEVLPAIFDGAAASRSPRWAGFGKRWGAAARAG